MKIQNINNTNANYKYQKNYSYKTAPMANDSFTISSRNKNVSFKAMTPADKFVLKMQAGMYAAEARSTYRDSSKVKLEAGKTLTKSNRLKTQAQQAQNGSAVIYLDAMSTYEVAQKKNFPNITDPKTGEITREFYDEDNGQFVMEEYNGDKTTRKVIYDEEVVMVIFPEAQSKSNKATVYTFDRENGELIQYALGVVFLDDGYKAEEDFTFKNGRFSSYDSQHKVIDSKYEKSLEHFKYQKGQLSEYALDWKQKENGTVTSTERLEYKNRQLEKASIYFEDIPQIHQKAATQYIYDDGALSKAMNDFTLLRLEKVVKSSKSFVFGDLGLKKIHLDLIADAKANKTTSSKLFYCENEVPTKCVLDYSHIRGEKETFSELVSF